MYREQVTTQDEALCHLFFHCSMKDERFDEAELDMVSQKMVEMGLQSELNFKEEILKYNNYKSTITNEDEYLQYLIEKINPVNDIALYSYCIEILLSDARMDVGEDSLLDKIAAALKLEKPAQEVTKKLMLQRKVIETDKIV
jgi:hypothetical protein